MGRVSPWSVPERTDGGFVPERCSRQASIVRRSGSYLSGCCPTPASSIGGSGSHYSSEPLEGLNPSVDLKKKATVVLAPREQGLRFMK